MDKEEYMMMVKSLKDKGYSDEEAALMAKLLLSAMGESTEEKDDGEDIAKIADAFESMRKIPPEGRNAYVEYLMSKYGKDKGTDEDFTTKLQNMILMMKTIDAIGKKGGDDEIKIILDKLERLEAKVEEKNAEQQEDKVSRLEAEIQQLRNEILSTIQSGLSSTSREETDFVDEAAEFAEKLQKMKMVLEQFGMVGKGGDISDAIEQLKKMGYEIKEPPSWSKVQAMMRQEMEKIKEEYEELIKKREEEIRRQAEEEAYKKAGLEKHKQKMLVDLFSAILNTVVNVSKSTGARKEVSSWGEMLRNVVGGVARGGKGNEGDTGAGEQ